jgi:hypothetical protein
VFAAIAALRALREQGRAHARCALVIECCEESGSYDLPAYLEALAPRIGTPDLVIGLDSGCGNYEQLWGTTSLRGLVNGVLTVQVLTEGVHSGDASGVVASSFRIARLLLDRIDDVATGVVKHAAFHAVIPPQRIEQAKRAAGVLGKEIYAKFPFVPGMKPMADQLEELVLNRTWRPMLAVTGADGLPPPASAGNVLRPKTVLNLSLRLPPTVDGPTAATMLKQILEADPPYGAKVTFEFGQSATGWHARETAPWLERAIEAASLKHYGKAGDVVGRRRHHTVHGDAGREVSAGAISHHRRTRSALERARPQRVPAPGLCGKTDRRRSGRPGGAGAAVGECGTRKSTAIRRPFVLSLSKHERPSKQRFAFALRQTQGDTICTTGLAAHDARQPLPRPAWWLAAAGGKPDDDQGTGTGGGRRDFHGRSVKMRDLVHVASPQAAAFARGALQAVETPEHFFPFRDRNAGAVVLELQDGAAVSDRERMVTLPPRCA